MPCYMRNTIHRKMTLVFCLEILIHSWLILLLCSVLEYLCKLIVVKHPVLDGSLSVHLINLEQIKQNDWKESPSIQIVTENYCMPVCLYYFPVASVMQWLHPPRLVTQLLTRIIISRLPTSSSVNLSPMVVRSSRSLSS